MRTNQEILKQYWGHEKFRPLQEDIINCVLEGNDCLALLPTGGGKSVCFQVPALAREGLCLVISPLIALMKDQVENLRKKGITAFSIHSGMTRKEVIQTLKVAGNSNCKFLYVSPERIETSLFKEYILSLNITLLAVDEAHCISQWGYDFRPSYLKLSELREELKDVPVLALTASATPNVQEDICQKLHLKNNRTFRQSFSRPNLSYSVFKVSSKINKIINILSKVNGTGIIYCKSRRKTKEISELLNINGISADYYHAGLLQEERNAKQESWLQDKTRVIVCTNAFGMGIDKPGVRVVIHADIPECLENYYQEAGRAGRDGKRSYAVLLYNDKETEDLKKSVESRFPNKEKIRKIYGSLMNFLQVPSGYGEGNSYEFDLSTFTKNFGLDTIGVTAALKTLEQEELLTFTEQVFVPSKVQVTASREELNEFEKTNPDLEPLIKAVLRSYEGILDQPVSIFEKMIASTLKQNVKEVETKLLTLHNSGIIRYFPQKEKPQVYLVQNRVKAEELQIDFDGYLKRKKLAEERIGAINDYVYTTTLCRSVIIGNYFGDREIISCGICDNCLSLKKKELSGKEFQKIHASILEMIGEQPLSMPDLLVKVNAYPREMTKEVLRFLQSEEKIDVNEEGLVSAKISS